MTVYKLEIVETLSRVVEIEAESADEAYCELKKQYNNEDIVLDASDYVDTEFLEFKE